MSGDTLGLLIGGIIGAGIFVAVITIDIRYLTGRWWWR